MVMLVQLLCPNRHCVLFGAYEIGNGTFDECCAFVERSLPTMGLNRHCGICGDTDLHFEESQTPYSTMEEAQGPLFGKMQEQLGIREEVDARGATFDSQREAHKKGKPNVN